MSPRRLLLAVAPSGPWPVVDGFTLRMTGLLRELVREWDVAMAAPLREDVEVEDEPFGFTHRLVVRSSSRRPFRECTFEDAMSTVRGFLAHRRPTAMLWWETVDFRSLKSMALPPTVCDRIDCMTLTEMRELRMCRGLRDCVRRLRAVVRSAGYERSVARTVQAVTVVGERDAEVLRRVSGRDNVYVVPNGVSVPDGVVGGDRTPEPTVVFSGVLAYEPNADAALYFATRVWPRVLRAVPNARFLIVGRFPTREISALEGVSGVTVQGDVPDMAAALRRAWVAVAPMRKGAGVKNKVLEAWAAGVPVVMSGIATNGLQLVPELGPLVCDGALEMGDRVVELLSSPERLQRLGVISMWLAREKHSWPQAASHLLRVLEAIALR